MLMTNEYDKAYEFEKTFGKPISAGEAFMYLIAGLFSLVPLCVGIYLCVKLILNWTQAGV